MIGHQIHRHFHHFLGPVGGMEFTDRGRQLPGLPGAAGLSMHQAADGPGFGHHGSQSLLNILVVNQRFAAQLIVPCEGDGFSVAARAKPTPMAATGMREAFRVARFKAHPLRKPPTTFWSGTKTLLNSSSAAPDARIPIFSSVRATLKPDESADT